MENYYFTYEGVAWGKFHYSCKIFNKIVRYFLQEGSRQRQNMGGWPMHSYLPEKNWQMDCLDETRTSVASSIIWFYLEIGFNITGEISTVDIFTLNRVDPGMFTTLKPAEGITYGTCLSNNNNIHCWSWLWSVYCFVASYWFWEKYSKSR